MYILKILNQMGIFSDSASEFAMSTLVSENGDFVSETGDSVAGAIVARNGGKIA